MMIICNILKITESTISNNNYHYPPVKIGNITLKRHYPEGNVWDCRFHL